MPEYVDIRPANHDETEAIVLHASMANPLNPHNIYVAANMSAITDKRVISFGNPSQPGMSHGTLSRKGRAIVAEGDFSPVLDTVARYLDQEKIETVTHVGGSYGADLAIAGARYDTYETDHIVAVEPVSGTKRGLIELAKDFAGSADAMQGYMDANELPAFTEAISEAGGDIPFAIGLLRATNIAISRGLARGRFLDNTNAALSGKDTKLMVSWGTESELCNTGTMRDDMKVLSLVLGKDRVSTLELPGQKHALTNDIHLYGAIVLTALAR